MRRRTCRRPAPPGRAPTLISGLGPRWLLILSVVWLGGLCVHTVVLTTAMPGLTCWRALTLNLSGSAVSNVMPLGGIAGTTLNLAMVRGWGHSNLDFARFVVVSKATDVVAKFVMPVIAVVGLLLCGEAPSGHVALWLSATSALAAAGGLLVTALLGRAKPLLRLAAAADRLRVRMLRCRDHHPDALWTSVVADLLAGADSLVRQRWARLSWGMAAYWLLQGALLWCCCAAVGLRAAPAVVLAALAAERALTLLAVTPGGTGLVEAGTIAVFIVLGADPTASLAAVLCSVLSSSQPRSQSAGWSLASGYCRVARHDPDRRTITRLYAHPHCRSRRLLAAGAFSGGTWAPRRVVGRSSRCRDGGVGPISLNFCQGRCRDRQSPTGCRRTIWRWFVHIWSALPERSPRMPDRRLPFETSQTRPHRQTFQPTLRPRIYAISSRRCPPSPSDSG